MNQLLLQKEVQDFVLNFTGATDKLAFSGSPFNGISIRELLQQIEGRRRIEKKLPSWYNTAGIIYPPKINLEQCSSELTAKYKAALCNGNVLADLTGGFGVDSFHFANAFEKVHYFETNTELCDIVKQNSNCLQVSNIRHHNEDGIEGWKHINPDVIYIDPSRRHEQKGKVIMLEDCEPNLLEHLEVLVDSSREVIVKLSPMFDISLGISGLKYVREVHVVSVKNEMKELLFVLDKSSKDPARIIAVNLDNQDIDTFDFEYGQTVSELYTDPLKYLYEPYASVMKSGGFAVFGDSYGLKKLATNTHLFTSEDLIDCPARRFKVTKTIPYNRKEIRNDVQGIQANISVRNFPVGVAELRKKFKIRDGGERYLFFASLADERRVVIFCEKVS